MADQSVWVLPVASIDVSRVVTFAIYNPHPSLTPQIVYEDELCA